MGFLDSIKDKLNLETKKQEDAGMKKEEGVTRLFFATDVHGSTVCWKKFVNSGKFYNADVLILGGDTTGKAIFPIIKENGKYRYTRNEEKKTVESEEELENVKKLMENTGFYPYVLDKEEYDDLKNSGDAEEKQDKIFEDEMKKRIRKWTEIAEERLSGNDSIYICPGNDDPFMIDEIWDESDRITICEGKVIDIDENYTMASSGWTNPTPWDTFREEEDNELEERLEEIISKVPDTDWCIFNFHAPPYDSQLDEAPELDEELRPKFGARSTEPVGSKAVKKLLEKYQPPLALHGHIHESRGEKKIGNTTAVNPGSVYTEGSLQGAVIDLKPEVDVVGLVRG